MTGSRFGRLLTLGGIVGLTVGVVAAKGSESSHKPTSTALGSTGPSSPAARSGAPASTTTSPSSAPSRSRSTAASSSTTTAPSTTTPAAPSPRKLVGAAESFPYGTIQVAVVLSGRRISDVVVLQAPSDGYSAQVAQSSLPTLRHEVLVAQSARIDTVSGASYDSQAYASSVQSALDRAGG